LSTSKPHLTASCFKEGKRRKKGGGETIEGRRDVRMRWEGFALKKRY
jgi:hypothetical protein